MKRAVERHAQGTATVVPVILKSTDWKTTPFGKLTARREGFFFFFFFFFYSSNWQSPDAAWADVAEGVRRLVNETS